VAFEAPSAGFLLDWRLLSELRRRGVGFATLTHAAGLSSTGDPALDARLPFDEAYDLPAATAAAISDAKQRGGRVIALGTTVTRALEHAAPRAQDGALPAGPGLATGRLGPNSELHLVDALVTGTHEPGESHYELLRAFAPDEVLSRLSASLASHGYRSHEFGDSVLLHATRDPQPSQIGPRPGATHRPVAAGHRSVTRRPSVQGESACRTSSFSGSTEWVAKVAPRA
jgi:S-adenosylmethionine:tRNA ribosyltransferase-isomerase